MQIVSRSAAVDSQHSPNVTLNTSQKLLHIFFIWTKFQRVHKKYQDYSIHRWRQIFRMWRLLNLYLHVLEIQAIISGSYIHTAPPTYRCKFWVARRLQPFMINDAL